MPCSDYTAVRLGKSVPPKKSHSWRSCNRTEEQSLNLTPENRNFQPDLPLNMGSSMHSDPRNDNHRGFEKASPAAGGPSEDLPLDFSLKPHSRRRLSDNTPKPTQERHSPVAISHGNPFMFLSRERVIFGGADFQSQTSIEANHRQTNRSSKSFYEQMMKTVVSPQTDPNSRPFDVVKSEAPNDQDFGSSTGRGRNLSHSPRLHSPNSSSPILEGMLARSSPDVSPAMPMEVINSRMFTLGLQNGYPSGHNSMCLPAGIPGPNPVMPNQVIFPPGGMVAPPPAMAFMQSPLNMLGPISPVPPPGKVESKASRKFKQERPFKNYDVSLQDDLQWPLQFPPKPTAVSPPLEAQQPAPRTAPHQNGTDNTNGNSNSSPDSDPAENSEMDNVPHSSVPGGSSPPEETPGTCKGRGRKRKPVADSEKDDSYWERRKKNNQAAKRSRENRRIKEDTVAQQALYFRGETNRLSQILIHLNARIHDISMKCASLEQDKLTLTAENAMFKQLVTQKRCGQCGNHLSDKIL